MHVGHMLAPITRTLSMLQSYQRMNMTHSKVGGIRHAACSVHVGNFSWGKKPPEKADQHHRGFTCRSKSGLCSLVYLELRAACHSPLTTHHSPLLLCRLMPKYMMLVHFSQVKDVNRMFELDTSSFMIRLW